MKVVYDEGTDTLTVILRDVPVAESDEERPGIVLDYDAAGNLVSIEVLDASTRVEDPRSVVMATTEGRSGS
jgi:YD repeat-containing protein